MKTPEWLKWALGETIDVKEGVLLAAAVLIILSALSG